MTRGRFVWILNAEGDCLVSPEFNGNMAPTMKSGEIAVNLLKQCGTEERFSEITKQFIYDFKFESKYDEEQLNTNGFLRRENIVKTDFRNVPSENCVGTYFENWSSDYVYIVNCTGSEIKIKNHENKWDSITADHLNVFKFGMHSEDELPTTLKNTLEKHHIIITKDDLTLIYSIKDVLESGVESINLKLSGANGIPIVDGKCFKSIGCNCVKVAKISDKGQYDSKSEARIRIETSDWHFPCPDYKYSNIKRNLERCIREITGIQEVEVKSFNTGIIEYDTPAETKSE